MSCMRFAQTALRRGFYNTSLDFLQEVVWGEGGEAALSLRLQVRDADDYLRL